MRHNGRPKMRLSTLNAGHLDLGEGHAPMVKCPHCPVWRVLQRSWMPAHQRGKRTRCPGSGQRFLRDLTREEWLGRLVEGNAEATVRKDQSRDTGSMSRTPAAL